MLYMAYDSDVTVNVQREFSCIFYQNPYYFFQYQDNNSIAKTYYWVDSVIVQCALFCREILFRNVNHWILDGIKVVRCKEYITWASCFALALSTL